MDNVARERLNLPTFMDVIEKQIATLDEQLSDLRSINNGLMGPQSEPSSLQPGIKPLNAPSGVNSAQDRMEALYEYFTKQNIRLDEELGRIRRFL